MNETEAEFVGTGWSFPPTFSKHLYPPQVVMSSGAADIQESLEILLSTSLGERIMLPYYGCNLGEKVFSVINNNLITELQESIADAILNFESRINVESVDVDTSKQLEGTLEITISYIIKSTNSRNNYVYPFYIREGTTLPQ